MEMNGKLTIIFHVICFICTILLVGRCIYQFIQDEDVSQVNYRKFHDKDSYVYPSGTICIKYPLGGNYWKENYSSNAAKVKTAYKAILTGQTFNNSHFQSPCFGGMTFEDLLKIDYDDATIKLEDFLRVFKVMIPKLFDELDISESRLNCKNSKSKSIQEELPKELTDKFSTPHLYISKRGVDEKCYTFDFPYISNQKVLGYEIHLENQKKGGLFYDPKKVGFDASEKTYSMWYHYPQQTMKPISADDGWESKFKNVSWYKKTYFLSDFEVLKRRDTRKNPCTNGNYDHALVQNIINEIGCKTFPIKESNETEFCKTKMAYRKFQKMLRLNNYPPPCLGITSMSKQQGETQNVKGSSNLASVIISVRFMDDSFKKLVYLQAYTIESLVGNVGGYIGLYSI